MVQRLAALALIIAALASTSCSSIKLGYRFADDLIERRVNPYLADSETKALAARKIDAYKSWHRRRMLPEHAKLLRRLATLYKADRVQPAALSKWFDALRGQWDKLMRGAIPLVASVLARHTSPSQLAHFRKVMAKKAKERDEESRKTRGKRLVKRVTTVVEGFERFTGRLGPAQRTLITRYSTTLVADNKQWRENSSIRRRALFALLEKRPSEGELRPFLNKMWMRHHEFSPPSYKRYSDAYMARVRQMVVAVLVSLDKKQRRKLVKTVSSYADDFAELSR